MSESRKIGDFDIKAPSTQLKTFVQVITMSEKRTRLSNGDKMAILEAIRIPGFKREDITTPKRKRLYHILFFENNRALFVFSMGNP